MREALRSSFDRVLKSVDQNWESLQAVGGLALQPELYKLDQIRATLEILTPEAAASIRAEFEAIFKEGAIAGDTLAQELIKARTNNTVRTFSDLPIVALANIATESMQRLKSHTVTFQNKATSILLQGISQGWGRARVKRELSRQLNIVSYRAERIQRTETLSALNAASLQRYQNERVALVQFLPTGDDRTCPICADRAGEVYRIDQAPKSQIHPLCRCVLVPADDLTLRDREWSTNFAKEVKELAGGKTDPRPAAFETVRPIPVEVFG